MGENPDLGVALLKTTDPAFYGGMKEPKIEMKDPKTRKKDPQNRKKLNDPEETTWDPLFQSDKIHGMLKIAGSSKDKVEGRLTEIKNFLKHGTVIEDAFQNKVPMETDSRVDGWTKANDRGKEQ